MHLAHLGGNEGDPKPLWTRPDMFSSGVFQIPPKFGPILRGACVTAKFGRSTAKFGHSTAKFSRATIASRSCHDPLLFPLCVVHHFVS